MSSNTFLSSTKAPAIPFSPPEFDRTSIDTTNNILRQYFNTIDNVTSSLLSANGGRYLSFPHISAQNSTDQYTTTNTATKVLWNTLDSGLGFALNMDSTATAEFTGVYKIDYSLQFYNTSPQIHDAYVWLRVNGVDVPGSASHFTVPNEHGGVPGALVAYSSVTFLITGGDDISLHWATNQAASAGGATGIYMHHNPAQVSPFPMTAIPSAIGSIVFVSGIVP